MDHLELLADVRGREPGGGGGPFLLGVLVLARGEQVLNDTILLFLGIVDLHDTARCRNHPVDTVVIGKPHLNDVHVFFFCTNKGFAFGGKVLPNSKWFQW